MLAAELVLPLVLESVLGSTSLLVLVAEEEEVLEAELRPVLKGVLLDL